MPPAFIGSSPYCYANSLAMTLGPQSPPPSAIEVLTGSPFGAQFVESGLPHFDPPGWDPDLGLDQAIGLLGWTCRRTTGGAVSEALGRLREAARSGPVLVGPVDVGLLLHQPWSPGIASGGDHWVVVLDVDDHRVLFHDPDGFPFATLPVDAFVAAWRAQLVDCAGPFTMRGDFRRTDEVDVRTALRRSLPAALRRLTGPSPTGSSVAVERLATAVEAGLDDRTRGHLTGFAVRVGARRRADASRWLGELGASGAAAVTDHQARLLGRLQYDLVTGDTPSAAAGLRQLAGTYDALRTELASAVTVLRSVRGTGPH
ncbi:hypothetical protein [Streptomyces albicerus]|uniref:hypothetical protein n=1 Tax=Streptomyces albicerus TaxID=2569859 RepID=UPI00124B5426|nr:hypothetical protein [Streptomyces albicerus]